MSRPVAIAIPQRGAPGGVQTAPDGTITLPEPAAARVDARDVAEVVSLAPNSQQVNGKVVLNDGTVHLTTDVQYVARALREALAGARRARA